MGRFLMKMIKILPVLLVFPLVVYGASRTDSNVRVGVGRNNQAGARMPAISGAVVQAALEKISVPGPQKPKSETSSATVVASVPVATASSDATVSAPVNAETVSVVTNGDCRDAYRACMDSFCLLEESQGERCACSDNIEYAKGKIKTILAIQAEADKLYTEGVEREQLGAKARLVFADNNTSTKISSVDFMGWLYGDKEDVEESGDIGEDVELGDDLYQMAVKYCSAELESCGSKAEMESMLYSRMIVQDCKNYDSYLADQKLNAESNKRTAESAVRKARLEMLDTTNKYNRGECLLAFRSCVADKGGCGTNFENCLDKKLLQRRSNACENVLDQCMAVRNYVIEDWTAESKSVLAEATKYADKYERLTCLARAQDCLEEGCATSTNAECLTNVNVAAGICPVITECDAKIPGFQSVINDKLGYLQIKFCENDIDKCLQDKCGVDFTKPECVGKRPYEIAALCPQDMFPSCKNVEQYDIIVQAALLQMDYQILQGCVNYFGEQLGKVCGTDMACLPIDATVESLTDLPDTEEGMQNLRKTVVANSDAAVEEFFVQFEQDKTVAACADMQSAEVAKKSSVKLKDKEPLGVSVFNAAKLLAKMAAENRNLRELDSKIAEIAREKDLEEAKKICLSTYKPEKPKGSTDDDSDEAKSNYSYIRTVSFEPDLRNCHVCRRQQVCEEGGESAATSALKAAAGGLSAGAASGTMVSAGWGTAIGGLVGGIGGAIMGAMSGGKKQFCQEVESCEDINM